MMLDNLLRIREPLAWASLGILVVAVVTPVTHILLYTPWADLMSWTYIAYAAQTRSSLYLLVLAAAVLGCAIVPETPRARLLATLAALVATFVVGLPLMVLAISIAAGTARFMPDLLPNLLSTLPETLLGIFAVVVLWILARREPEEDDEVEDDEVEAIAPVADGAEPAPERPTVWNRSEATGTAWRTADEAASGAPGSASLAVPEETEDWGPPPRP